MTTNRIRVLAVAVFREGDRILVAGATDPATGLPFFRPLGGGVEFGETAAGALAREIREELGESIEGVRLLGVLENLFQYAGRPGHEVMFVFDARFSDPTLYSRSELPVIEAGAGWDPARWIPLGEFASGQARLVPEGLLPFLQAQAPPSPAG